MATKLSVEVLEARELQTGGLGEADPYVKLWIENYQENREFVTKTFKNSRNPVWNQNFNIGPLYLFLGQGTLNIEVYDKDKFSRDDFLGRCKLALDTLRPEKQYHVWLTLNDCKSGKIRVKLEASRATDPKNAAEIAQVIINHCKNNRCKFSDAEFPPNDSSMFKNPKAVHEFAAPVSWKRPPEFTKNPRLFVDGIESGDVIQGGLGDCYFLGALSVVATRKDLLMPLFVSTHPEYGFYQIKYFKNGEWRVITIDDRIPIAAGRPIYGRCKDNDELWVPLMEKAYAKLHLCYEALEAGNAGAALTDLTGESVQIYTFNDDEVQQMTRDGRFWRLVQYFVKESFLMGCSLTDEHSVDESDNGMGILKNHAYGILDAKEPEPNLRLMQLRNPWGKREWKGRFSDNSKDWTPELMRKLNVVFEDDGTFWMAFEDFVTNFNNLNVLRLLTDIIGTQWHRHSFTGEFKGLSAAGCMNNPGWHNNPQYGMVVPQPTKVFISVAQPDARLKWQDGYSAALGIYILRTPDAHYPKLTCAPEELVAKTSGFYPSRDVAIEIDVEPSTQYIIIPCTFETNYETKVT